MEDEYNIASEIKSETKVAGNFWYQHFTSYVFIGYCFIL